MQTIHFPTGYTDILERVHEINPLNYARSRNFLDGAVTYLSPYISRGVISSRQVMQAVLAKGYTTGQAEKFIQELAWREYFQRVWQYLEDDMFEDIRNLYTGIRHTDMIASLQNAATGISAVDKGINDLYETGYMHNHLRMYTASIACNIGKAHWQAPSQWMYYHLLDGDLASNACSWQWVAGTFSSKQYYCNQDNINHYTGSSQQDTFLDKDYSELMTMDVPEILRDTCTLDFSFTLHEKTMISTDSTLPLLLYNSYNLDPDWRSDIKANRVLLLEPSHFRQFPVSEKVIRFILSLAKNIEGIQIFVGEAAEIPGLHQFPFIASKEHPAFRHYPGIKDERDWIFPELSGYYNSFFSYWKKAEAILRKQTLPAPALIRA